MAKPNGDALRNLPSLIVFLLIAVGGGLLIGFLTAPGEWYAGLAKPAFNPPNWLFAPVWTALYVLIGIAGWRIWNGFRGSQMMNLWFAQMVANFLWSPVFFAAHMPGAALVVIVILLALILAFIGLVWNRDRVAASLFIPYAAWVAFATLLNFSIWQLN